MKIICVVLLIFCFISCKKYVINDDLSFVPQKSIKIKNITLLQNKSVSIGSYTLNRDTVLSQFKIQSKYSLIIIKLKNASTDLLFNTHKKPDYPTPGYFSIVDEGLYEVKISPGFFEEKEKINKIDFFSNKEITFQINTDSIKSFDVNFKKFAIKINNNESRVLYGNIEYYGLENLDAQMLFYKLQNETYIFIMSPLQENVILEKNFLYNYLFN